MAAFNPTTKKEYDGGNQMFLSIVSKAYPTSEFAGFNQWKKNGRSVKKGEKGYKILVIFKDKKGDKKPTTRTVFNKEQTELIKEKNEK